MLLAFDMLYMTVQFCRHSVPLVLTYISILSKNRLR